ncbi:MAG TPA: hypothetical protein VFR68_01515 [Candidatus Dormibacteraeota bacterium]|nr:hypothetical protein [Candidatus Dormibacteraeota bacterium]
MFRPYRVVAVLTLAAALTLLTVEPSPSPPTAAVTLELPSYKGLNYGVPLTLNGDWVGTAWLGVDQWPTVYAAMAADLSFVQARHLGRVVRLFLAIDQMMESDSQGRFVRFDEDALARLDKALDLFDAHQIRVIGVLFDQEVRSSPGNFRFAAIDGRHPAMRSGYLVAAQQFLRRYQHRRTIAGWDLFNEAYASLGTTAGLPRPPAPDPVSPGYPTGLVHQFLRDLYLAAKQAQPDAPLTVSDATLYWQPQADRSIYDDILDFYDVHIYDDHPNLTNLRAILDKPFIIGEAGAAVEGNAFTNQEVEPGVVKSILEQGGRAGASAVLIHSIASQNIFPSTRDRLTPTGEVLAAYQETHGGSAEWPIVPIAPSLVGFVTARSTDCTRYPGRAAA